jgi:nicotinamidase-related amidase
VWVLVGVTTALLLIDLQNDYFADDELARCREDLVSACNQLVDKAREAGSPVIEIQTVHAPDRSTWALNMLEDGQGMAIEGSDGARRVPGLHDADEVVVKTRDSAFFGTRLEEILARRGVSRLVLAGVSTESCIAATATDAYARNLVVVPVRDATASVEESLHEQTLDRLEQQYRQRASWAVDVTFDQDATARE